MDKNSRTNRVGDYLAFGIAVLGFFIFFIGSGGLEVSGEFFRRNMVPNNQKPLEYVAQKLPDVRAELLILACAIDPHDAKLFAAALETRLKEEAAKSPSRERLVVRIITGPLSHHNALVELYKRGLYPDMFQMRFVENCPKRRFAVIDSTKIYYERGDPPKRVEVDEAFVGAAHFSRKFEVLWVKGLS